MIYSIDMVRLKSRVMDYDLYPLLQKLSSDTRVEHWESNSFKSYHHNFRVQEGEEFSFYIGLEHNTKRTVKKKDLVVEFNPNKFVMSSDSLLYYILFRYFRDDFIVVSVDVAIDLDILISEIYFDRNYKQNYKYFKSNIGETHYIGEGDGRVKVYDKKKEQLSKGLRVDKESWTRIEYSIRLDEKIENILKEDYYKKVSLVDFYRKSKYDCNDKSLKAILYAVNNGYDIKDLTRYYRDKIKKIICNDKIDITEEEINKCIKDYFKEYKGNILDYFNIFYNPFIENL